MRFSQRRFITLVVMGLAAQAGAQQVDDPGPIAQVEVKGAATSYDPRRDDTAARIVVRREEIVRYGDSSLADVFKRIPGVNVSTGSGRSVEVRMRGLAGGYTQILVNGERTPAGFALDSVAPEQIERIEVLRVATAEFSTESVAGTINLVLRKAARKRTREVKLGYLASSDFRGPTFNLDLGEVGERSSYALTASGNHDSLSREASSVQENTRPDGIVDLRRTTLVPEHGRMNRLNLGPRFNWTLDNGDTLSWESLATGSSFRNHGHAVTTTLVGAPPRSPDLQTFGEFDDRMLKSDLRWNRKTALGTEIDIKFGIEGSSRKMFVRRRGFDGAGRPETDGTTLSDTHARGMNSTGKAARTIEGGHLLALGWDIGANESEDLRVERDRVRRPAPGQLFDEQFRARVGRAAFFVQDEWTLDPRLSVYLGARWEGVRTHVSGTGFAQARVNSHILSPIVQALWKLAGEKGEKGEKGDQLRLALSRTYKAPDLFAIVPLRGAWENNSPTEADYQGNPNLKPELAWGLDAAWEHYWAEGAMVSLSGAVRRIEDYTSNRIYFDGVRWVFTPANEDRASMRSIDLETKFPLASLLPGAPAIDLRASVSRNWSRVASVPGPDNRMERQTPLTANLGIDYKSGALITGSSVAYRRGALVRVSANRGFYTPSRTDLDAYVLWAFNKKVQLRLAASNLLGADDAFEPSYTDPVAGVETRSWRYPGGVKLRTTLEASF
jgi:outer membrane receptor protein involved in Fe transport